MPSPEELRAHYATSYSLKDAQQHIQSENRRYYREHLDELLSLLGVDAASCAIVDFGCSYPVLLEEAKALGFSRAIGVESDEAACRYGRERDIEMCSVDEFCAGVQPQSVDVIRFSHVLEHLIDPLGTLTMAASKVRPGGVVHITQPGFPVLAAVPSAHDLKDSVWPEHLQFFSPISLKIMLDAARIAPLSFYTHTNADDVVSKLRTATGPRRGGRGAPGAPELREGLGRALGQLSRVRR